MEVKIKNAGLNRDHRSLRLETNHPGSLCHRKKSKFQDSEYCLAEVECYSPHWKLWLFPLLTLTRFRSKD